MVMDVPTTFGGTYTPLNYDQKFRGPVSVRRALGASLNVPAVKALEFVGMDAMLQTVHRMGINGLRDPARYGLSVTLGGGEVTLLDLTYAYTPFANNGLQTGLPLAAADRTPSSRQFEPVAILEIRRGDGAAALPAAAGRAESRSSILVWPTSSPTSSATTRPAPRRSGRTARSSSRGHRRRRPAPPTTYRDSWVIGYTPGPGGRRLGRQQRRQPDARRR